MPRKLRLEYAGAIYHVMNRGDRREAIFLDDKDWEMFLRTLAEGCRRTEWQVQAYCLMNNHLHLVLETPQANLVSVPRFHGVFHQAITLVMRRIDQRFIKRRLVREVIIKRRLGNLRRINNHLHRRRSVTAMSKLF